MPCRPTLLCRHTAHQAQQHVWITDDVLAEAFHRYARASFHHSRLGEGSRHGSSVPGPLEARRRLAKRRMGVAAVSAANPSPASDLGALFSFGFGGNSSRSSPECGWRWEAPQPPTLRPSLATREQKATGWAFEWPDTQQQHESWDDFLRMPDFLEPVSKEDLINESKMAMNALLMSRDYEDVVNKDNLADITRFLQTSSDEPGANNMLRLFDWLVRKQISIECIQEIVSLMKHKFRLGTLDIKDIASMLASLTHSDKSEQLELLTACLNIFSADSDFDLLCTSITRQCLEQQTDDRKPQAETLRWLQALRECNLMQGLHHPNRTWQSIYPILAAAYHEPGHIARHLITLRKIDLSHILLRYWLPHVVVRDKSSLNAESLPVAHNGSTKRWTPSHQPNVDNNLVEKLADEFRKLRQGRYESAGTRTRKFSSLVDLLSVLQDHQVPHIMLTHDICEILKRARPTELFGIFRELRRHPKLGISTELAHGLIRHFVAYKQLRLALLVFEAVPTLSLRHCYDLALRLANQGTVPSARVFRMILRQTSEDILPRDESSVVAHSQENLSPARVDIVHLLAHAFAKCPNISDRVAFRRVWECYRFLKNHHAPISTVLSRAIVHAGVIRSLNDWKRVSTNKFKWILDVVSSVEGPEVARSLDRLAFQIWTRDIAPKVRVMGKRDGSLQKRAEIGPNELQATRIRVKSWHSSGYWIGRGTL